MASWFSRLAAQGQALGPLEWRVLESLWSRDESASVRDLQPEFPEIAYTTLMTTLDRLHRKRVLSRTKQGRAFYYQPALNRSEFESARVADVLRLALESGDAAFGPLLSCLVRTVGERDEALLDELEALARARRAELEGRRS